MHFLSSVFLELSWNSDDESDNIFGPERSFSVVFNTFVHHWRVKNDEMYLTLHSGSYFFRNSGNVGNSYKKFDFQHYRETKISQIIVFWANREIKMP